MKLSDEGHGQHTSTQLSGAAVSVLRVNRMITWNWLLEYIIPDEIYHVIENYLARSRCHSRKLLNSISLLLAVDHWSNRKRRCGEPLENV
jgi:hypothetical protein